MGINFYPNRFKMKDILNQILNIIIILLGIIFIFSLIYLYFDDILPFSIEIHQNKDDKIVEIVDSGRIVKIVDSERDDEISEINLNEKQNNKVELTKIEEPSCKEGYILNKNDELCYPEKIAIVKEIAEDYYKTHTYSKYDLFVCSDMAIDVWNLIKSKGINAKIYVGNTNKDNCKGLEDINHAWVVAETTPFKWLAVETTTGEIIFDNKRYYLGYSFNSPKEFKKFIDLRKDYVKICNEAIELGNEFNTNYANKTLNYEGYELKGKTEQKINECKEIINQLQGLLVM